MATVVFSGTNVTEADFNSLVEETSNLFLSFDKDKDILLFFLQGELRTDSILKDRLQQIFKKQETNYACMSRSLLMRMRNKLISSI